MNHDLIRELKTELKRRAAEIRAVRKATKDSYRNSDNKAWVWNGPKEFTPLWCASSHYRHLHIAYCLLRGRTYAQIEPNCHNPPNWEHIEAIKECGLDAYRSTPWIQKLDGKGFVPKTDAYKHQWDQVTADLHAVKEQVDSMGRTSFEHVSIGQFQKLKDLMRKAFGGK